MGEHVDGRGVKRSRTTKTSSKTRCENTIREQFILKRLEQVREDDAAQYLQNKNPRRLTGDIQV